MWLLLEYDVSRHDEARAACTQAGIACVGVMREDQLTNLDLTQVDLLLIGDRWKLHTVTKLREKGMTAPVVLIAETVDEDARGRAAERDCVDIVSYPLPIDYVRAWARPSVRRDVVDMTGDAIAQSPMEELLRTKPARIGKQMDGHTQMQPSLAFSDDPFTRRGRILLTYGLRGGIGKSTLTSLLAQHMGLRQFSVAVVELDPKGNWHERLQIQPPITVDDWAKMPSALDERMVRQALVRPRTVAFSLLPRGEHTRAVEASTVRRLLTQLAAYYDLVLVDASTDDELASTQVAREMAHRVLYVMTPAWDSFRSFLCGYEQVRLQKGDEGVTVVVNRNQGTGEHQKAWRLLQEAKILHLIRVPEDRTVREQARIGQALTGGRQVQRALAQLTADLALGSLPGATQEKRGRWFR